MQLPGAKNKTHDNDFNLSEEFVPPQKPDSYRKLELPCPLHPAVRKVPSSAEGVFVQLRDGTGLPQFSAEHTGRKTQRAWSISQVTETPSGNCQHAG